MIAEGFPAEDIKDCSRQTPTPWCGWTSTTRTGPDLQILVEEFGLHPWRARMPSSTISDPKLDRYHTHLFANMYAVSFDQTDQQLTTSELSAFITPRALITGPQKRRRSTWTLCWIAGTSPPSSR